MSEMIEPLPNAVPRDTLDQTRPPRPWPRVIGLLGRWLVASVLTTVGAIIFYPVVASSVFFLVAYGSLTASPDDLPPWGWAIVFGLLATPLVLIGASLTGLVQVLALGRLVPRPLRWWGATVAGAAVAGLLVAGPALAMLLMLAVARGGVVLEGRGDLALYYLVIGAGVGIAQGVAQGLALDRRVPGRWWWMAASGGATVAAWLVIASAAWQRTRPEFYPVALLVAVAGGAVYGLLSGPVLLWLLRDRLSKAAARAEDAAEDAATQARRAAAEADIAARRTRPGRSWLQRWLD